MTVLVCQRCKKQVNWVTRTEAAKMRGVALGTINNWLQRGLEHERLGTIQIKETDLMNYKPNRSGRPLG